MLQPHWPPGCFSGMPACSCLRAPALCLESFPPETPTVHPCLSLESVLEHHLILMPYWNCSLLPALALLAFSLENSAAPSNIPYNWFLSFRIHALRRQAFLWSFSALSLALKTVLALKGIHLLNEHINERHILSSCWCVVSGIYHCSPRFRIQQVWHHPVPSVLRVTLLCSLGLPLIFLI